MKSATFEEFEIVIMQLISILCNALPDLHM